MKKRILALALCLCMAALWVPVTARAATSVSDAKAYLDALSKHNVDASYLLDFDGDGRDELLLIWIEDGRDGLPLCHCAVWQGSKQLWAVGDTTVNYAICQGGGKFYVREDTPNSTYAFSTVRDGTWVVAEERSDRGYDSYTDLTDSLIPYYGAITGENVHSELRAALNRNTLAADAQAYLDVLDSQSYENSYLLDFDADGRSELLVVRQQGTNDYYYSVWQGSKCLASNVGISMAVNPDLAVYVHDGKTYLGDSNSDEFSYLFLYTVKDGAWVETTTFNVDLYDMSDSYLWTYSVNGQRVSPDKYNEEYASYKYQYSVHPWNNPKVSDVRPLLTELAMASMKPQDILKKVTYYGDVSKCKLTAQQAEAMANALEAWTTVGAGGYATPVLNCAYLVDGDGSGIPALVTLTSYYTSEPSYFQTPGAADWEDLDLYTWEAGGLTKSASLEASWMGGYGTIDFGKLPNGQYGWNEGLEWMGTTNLQRFSLKNGALVKGDAYEMHADWNFLHFKKNEELIINRTFEEANGDGALWDEWAAEVTDLYNDSIKADKLESHIDYNVGNTQPELVSLLRAYAKSRRFPSYTYALLDAAGNVYDKLLSAVGVNEAAEVHTLADGLYYVIYPSGEAYQGALVREIRENGKKIFRLERTDTAPVEQAELEPIVTEALTKPNFTLDFSRIRRTATLEELRAYLTELLANMDAPAPNDPTKSDLAAFVDSAVSTLSTKTLSGKKNHLAPDSDTVSQLVAQAQEVYDSLSATLEENDVTLNKTVTPTVRAVWSNVELDKPCQIDLDRLAARALDGCNLQLLLGDAQTWLGFTADDLKELTRELDGALRLQFSQEGDKVYALRFLDKDGEVVEQLSRPITVSLPAASALDTIMVSYAGGSDNWGGQFDPAAGAISFEARYSGQYEVLENNVDIDDIEGLSEESRAAISFMVSKGYLSADNGLFRPGDPLTRYEFTEALVGMFFALDRELTCDFPDVDASSPYYPYVASAQAKSIVNGYDDGTFSGDDPINREQVFALAARTLMDQKGYAQPANFEQYLTSFTDRADLSAWAAPQVALSVREGVAGRGSVLLPQANITREQAAVVLYRLFQLLYEVSPAALDLPAGGGGLSLPVVIGGAVAAVAAVGGGAGFVLWKKRKKPVSAE